MSGSQTNQSQQTTLGLQLPDAPYEVYTGPPSEIVIGIVGPLGTDNEKARRLLSQRLDVYGYHSELIRISAVVIPALAGPEKIPEGPKYERAKALIDLGNLIRRESKNNAVLAIAAAAEVHRRRSQQQLLERTAYIVSSLKLPEEVAELRKIYGNGFYLFAIHTDRERRAQYLATDGQGMPIDKAWELVIRDEHETASYGQHTRDTFHRADFFIADENDDDKLAYSIERCLDLIFGNPTITPTFDEFGMFMAFAASLRSADLSRQVGAVVARGRAILATGANDCPSPGGGLYWPSLIGNRVDDAPRGRDYKRGYDSNSIEKSKLIEEIAERFRPEERAHVSDILEHSGIADITEYGRMVHAEMEALLACAREGISCVGADLYCTTFPCHNCAKHIIAAGIDQVIYVEPYPKSKALEFHDDAVTTVAIDCASNRVLFKPFIGVGPRKFFELFSMSLSSGRPLVRKTHDGRAVTWVPSAAVPRTQMLPVSHRTFEEVAAEYLKKLTGEEEVKGG